MSAVPESRLPARVALAAAGSLAGLLLLEAFCRVAPFQGVRLESFRVEEAASPFLGVISRPKRRGFYRASDLLGYEHEENAAGFTNRHGMTGREHPLAKAPGTFRVLLMGDSIAEPHWAGDSLEDELGRSPECRKVHERFEVWNAGVGSYDVRRYGLYLRQRAARYSPDLIVLFIAMNDFGLDTNTYYKKRDGFIGYHFPLESLRRRGFIPSARLLRRSALYRCVLLRADTWLAARDPGREADAGATGRRYMREILAAARALPAPIVFVVFPYLTPEAARDERQRAEYAAITSVLGAEGTRRLDLSPLFADLRRQDFPLRYKPEDVVHPSPAAYRRISREIGAFLVREKML